MYCYWYCIVSIKPKGNTFTTVSFVLPSIPSIQTCVLKCEYFSCREVPSGSSPLLKAVLVAPPEGTSRWVRNMFIISVLLAVFWCFAWWFLSNLPLARHWAPALSPYVVYFEMYCYLGNTIYGEIAVANQLTAEEPVNRYTSGPPAWAG